jgi:hypothetical protein
MSQKVLSKKELNQIENLILTDEFSLSNVNNAITIVKNKFCVDNPPKYRNGRSKLWDYSGDINNHFSKRLLRPKGITSYSKEIVESEGLELNLRELLFLKESFNQQEKSSFERFKDYIVNRFMSVEERVMNNLDKEQELQDLYNKFKSTKYQSFFEDLKGDNLEKLNLSFKSFSSFKDDIGLPPLMEKVYSVLPDQLEAKVREVIYHPDTKEVISFTNY